MKTEEIAAVFERILREPNFSQEEKRCAANMLNRIHATSHPSVMSSPKHPT